MEFGCGSCLGEGEEGAFSVGGWNFGCVRCDLKRRIRFTILSIFFENRVDLDIILIHCNQKNTKR